MKKGLVSGIVLLVIGLVCGALLAGVNAFTKPVIEENQRQAKLAVLAEFYQIDQFKVEIIELKGSIDTVFLLKNLTNESIIEKAVYSVRARGYQSDIVMLIAVNKDLTIDQYKVVDQAETSGIGDVIVGYNFGMSGQNVQNLDAFVGPTARVSADAVKKCFEIVRDRVSIDFAGAIPQLDYNFDSIRYNLDIATLVAKPFIATITVGTGSAVELYLGPDFSFVEMVNGTEQAPASDILADVKLKAQASASVTRRAMIQSINESTNTVVVRVQGYNFDAPITITFVLNEGMTAIQSFTVNSAETYDSGEYSGTHGVVPGVENYLLQQYQANQSLDSVAGATTTSTWMIRATQLIDLFLKRTNGGA